MPKYDKSAWHPREYETLDDLSAELDRIQAAHDAGTLETTGNWSEGQIFDHCSKLIGFSIDGFDASAPWFFRMICKVLIKPFLGKMHMKPGIKLPAKAASLMPAESRSFEDGMGMMRAQIARLNDGVQMTQNSPIFGKMRHEQWMLVHLSHCRMHFGYIQFGTTET